MLLVCMMFSGCTTAEKEKIIVGSKDFPEQFILGNMLVLLIEEHTDFAVIYRENMASHIIFAAIDTGAVDLYIDYTGTVYGYYLIHSETKPAEEVFDISSRELMERHNIRMLGQLGFNNSYNLAVRQNTAEEFNLRTISDLAKVSSDMIFGGSSEIINRNDGLPNLKRLYDMSFKEERDLHDTERFHAISKNEIQVSEVFTTDALIKDFNLVVLEDDLQFFPPYQGVVLIRNEIAEKHPELIEILGRLEGLLTDDIVRELNFRVVVMNESPRAAAEFFLLENGLIR